MLISIEGGFEQFAAIDADVLELALSELARAHRRGNHMAVVDRECAKWFVENLDLHKKDSALFTRLGAEYTQTKQLKDRAEHMVRLVPARYALPEKLNCVDLTCYDFLRLNISDETHLLLEDATYDGYIYDQILSAIRQRSKLPNLSYRHSHGGGTATIRMLKQLIDEKRCVVTILDSDRQSPVDPVPAKVREHVDLYEGNNWPHGLVICLPCREVENLIPIAAIKLLDCAVERKVSADWIEAKQRQQAASGQRIDEFVSMFFDIKNGVTTVTLAKDPHQPSIDWWSTHRGEKDYPGFGKTVARQFGESNQAVAVFRKQIGDNGVLQMLITLFDKLVWFLVAAMPSRV